MITRSGRLLVLVVLAIAGFVLLGGMRFTGRDEGGLPAANPAAAAVTSAPSATGTAGPAAASPSKDSGGEALKKLQESLQSDPTNATAWRDMGRHLAERRDYAGAAEAFAAAAEFAPDDARLRNDLGSALLYMGLVRVARAQFERSMALDGAYPEARFNLAITLSHTQPADTPRALQEWQRVVEMAPGTEIAKMAQGYIDEYSKPKTPGASPHGASTPTPTRTGGN